MSKHGEKTLFGLLTDKESIEALLLAGFKAEAIPSPDLQLVYDYVLKYYRDSGRILAPTPEVFINTEMEGQPGKTLANVLEEHNIFLDVLPEESIEWAIEDLNASYITRTASEWTRSFSEDLMAAAPADRHDLLSERATDLVALSVGLESRRTAVNLKDSAQDILSRYEARERDPGTFRGMGFGFDPIDTHIRGIREGELAVVGAYAKIGKSYLLAHSALSEFNAGRNVALFTLENSNDMTQDRIACLATGISPEKFEAGKLNEYEKKELQAWVNDVMFQKDNHLWILRPDKAQRTPQHMVMEAQIREADSLLIDQLTFMEAADQRQQRYLQIRQMMHDLKSMISGRDPISCLLAHQINRDGWEQANRVGYHRMDDFAEGSEVERTADIACSMYQSADGKIVGQMLFQILAARRVPINNWDLDWDIDTGSFTVIGENDLND